MLTKDLIRFRRVKDRLKPSFIDVSDWRYLRLAEQLLALYSNGIGQTRENIEEQAAMIVNACRDIKLAKGLNKICLDRTEFEKPGKYDYPQQRAELFKMVGKLLHCQDLEDYDLYQMEIFKKSGENIDFVQGSIYGDLPHNEMLIKFKVVSPPAVPVEAIVIFMVSNDEHNMCPVPHASTMY